MLRGLFNFAELDQVIRQKKLGVVVPGVGAQRGFQIPSRSGIIAQLVEGNAQERRRGRHFGVNLQPLLQNRSGFLVLALPKIKRAQIVVGRRQARRNLKKRFVTRSGACKITMRFRGFCIAI